MSHVLYNSNKKAQCKSECLIREKFFHIITINRAYEVDTHGLVVRIALRKFIIRKLQNSADIKVYISYKNAPLRNHLVVFNRKRVRMLARPRGPSFFRLPASWLPRHQEKVDNIDTSSVGTNHILTLPARSSLRGVAQ